MGSGVYAVNSSGQRTGQTRSSSSSSSKSKSKSKGSGVYSRDSEAPGTRYTQGGMTYYRTRRGELKRDKSNVGTIVVEKSKSSSGKKTYKNITQTDQGKAIAQDSKTKSNKYYLDDQGGVYSQEINKKPKPSQTKELPPIKKTFQEFADEQTGQSYLQQEQDYNRYQNIQYDRSGNVVGYQDTFKQMSIGGEPITQQKLYQGAAKERVALNKRMDAKIKQDLENLKDQPVMLPAGTELNNDTLAGQSTISREFSLTYAEERKLPQFYVDSAFPPSSVEIVPADKRKNKYQRLVSEFKPLSKEVSYLSDGKGGIRREGFKDMPLAVGLIASEFSIGVGEGAFNLVKSLTWELPQTITSVKPFVDSLVSKEGRQSAREGLVNYYGGQDTSAARGLGRLAFDFGAGEGAIRGVRSLKSARASKLAKAEALKNTIPDNVFYKPPKATDFKISGNKLKLKGEIATGDVLTDNFMNGRFVETTKPKTSKLIRKEYLLSELDGQPSALEINKIPEKNLIGKAGKNDPAFKRIIDFADDKAPKQSTKTEVFISMDESGNLVASSKQPKKTIKTLDPNKPLTPNQQLIKDLNSYGVSKPRDITKAIKKAKPSKDVVNLYSSEGGYLASQNPTNAFKKLFDDAKYTSFDDLGISIYKQKKPVVKKQDFLVTDSSAQSFKDMFKTTKKADDFGITITKTTKPKKKVYSVKDVLGKTDEVSGTTTGTKQQTILKTETKQVKEIELKLDMLEETKTKTKKKTKAKLKNPLEKEYAYITGFEEVKPQKVKQANKLTSESLFKEAQVQRVKAIEKMDSRPLTQIFVSQKLEQPQMLKTATYQEQIVLSKTKTGLLQKQQSKSLQDVSQLPLQKVVSDFSSRSSIVQDQTIIQSVVPMTQTIQQSTQQNKVVSSTFQMPKSFLKLDEEDWDKKKKKKGLFSLIIGTKGTQNYKMLQGLELTQAARLGKKMNLESASASFKITKSGGRELSSKELSMVEREAGSKFTRGKKDSSRFVQKNQFRISSSGEKRDITFKGIQASKTSLLQSSKKTRQAKKMIDDGFKLKEVRGLL
jgi:hypothetical protein